MSKWLERVTGPLGVMVAMAAAVGAGGLPAEPAWADANGDGGSQVQRRELGQLVLENIPPIAPQIKQDLAQYQSTRSASLRGWVADGSGIVISTRFGETSQLHRVRAAGGARHQLTFFDEPVGSVAVSPEHAELFYSRDVGGSEFYQIFHLDLSTGKSTAVSQGRSRDGGVLWSNDGERFMYFSTRRNGTDWDLYLGERTHPAQSRPVLEAGGTWFALDFSPADDAVIVERYVSSDESHLHVLDLASGKLAALSNPEAKISYGYAMWAADGEHVYLTSDASGQFSELQILNVRTGALRALTADIPWDVSSFTLSPDRQQLAFSVNEDGWAQLYLLNTRTLRHQRVPGLPAGQIYNLQFSPDGRRLGLVLNTPRTPGDVYVLDVAGVAGGTEAARAASSATLQRWTYSEVGGLDTERFVVPELIEYDTFDQVDGRPRKIPAFYYRPHGDGPFPVTVRIHGGPASQYRPSFSSTIQYYVNELGVAAILPNVRGSTGRGREYAQLDDTYKREDSVRDIGALLDWIALQPELDASRVSVRGGSYGGYMVLASMIRYPQRLACGVDVVGISNFVTFLENTQAYRRDLRRPEYGDERDPKMRAFLESISPANQAQRITRPMFIAQGLNDPRVPAGESEQMVAAMRANGQDVRYMLAKDEGHGFAKKSNRDFFTAAEVMFTQDCLLR